MGGLSPPSRLSDDHLWLRHVGRARRSGGGSEYRNRGDGLMRQHARRGHCTVGAMEGGWQELQPENQSGR